MKQIPDTTALPRIPMADFGSVACLAHNAAGRVFEVRWKERPAVVKFPADPGESRIHCLLQGNPGVLELWAIVMDPEMGEGLLMPRAQTDLQGELDRGTRVSPLQLFDAARALAHMHAIGWLHRDVHPGNLVLHEGTWKLIDFGLSRLHEGGFRCPRQSHAVIRFASVTQLENAVEQPADDWYSFGLVALSALHGKMPWQGMREPQILLRKTADPFSAFGNCATRKWLLQLAGNPPPNGETVAKILNELSRIPCTCGAG